MVEWIKGKKTYIVSVLMIVVALVQTITGELSWSEFFSSDYIRMILEGFGLGFLRAGVTKSGS